MPRADKIQLALNQLIEHTVPVYEDDDDEAVEQRLDDAYALAHDLINSYASRHLRRKHC
jgi:hypothetical protein